MRWVMIDLHGGEEIPPELDAVLRPDRRDALQAVLQRDKDTGSRETIAAMLRRLPGGLALHVRAPRLLVDLNRRFDADPHAAGRHSLVHLPAWAELRGEAGQRAIDAAAQLHASVRGPSGVITALHRALPATVPFWDFHTYDPHNPDRTPRPQVQMFSGFEGQHLVPRPLCAAACDALSGLPEGLRVPAEAIGVDAPYAMFDGCLLPELRGRALFATELRKDVFGPAWAAGRVSPQGAARAAAQMSRVLELLLRATPERASPARAA